MKKIVFKDTEEFHDWQSRIIRGLDESGKEAVCVMDCPLEYPCLLVWDIHEEYDFDRSFTEPFDALDYKYVYLGDFPVKKIKQGTYVYQVFQTGDCC